MYQIIDFELTILLSLDYDNDEMTDRNQPLNSMKPTASDPSKEHHTKSYMYFLNNANLKAKRRLQG